MKICRDITNRINWLIDELCPPIIRDCRWLYKGLYTILFGKEKAVSFLTFRERIPFMSSAEYDLYYQRTSFGDNSRATDINSKCIQTILDNIAGETVLDIACGRGYLSHLLKKDFEVSGVDIKLDYRLFDQPKVHFVEGDICEIPFPDDTFDTVVCAHTLEHIVDAEKALAELRRVCNKRLIIIVPRQRPAKYTFDLHVHFFPYMHDLLLMMNAKNTDKIVVMCKLLDNDFIYIEDNCVG